MMLLGNELTSCCLRGPSSTKKLLPNMMMTQREVLLSFWVKKYRPLEKINKEERVKWGRGLGMNPLEKE
jgi:hypothetical protein